MIRKVLTSLFGRSATPAKAVHLVRRSGLAARYDSAQTTADNTRHWAHADGLSPNAANSPAVRRILRNRARYEVANNCYAKHIVQTVANDLVGTGPRLQMQTGDTNANQIIEREFAKWAREVKLGAKLRLMRRERAESGEVFALFTSNPALKSQVKLDLRVIEPDQVTSSIAQLPMPNEADGILFDSAGNPTSYSILRRHPGDATYWVGAGLTDYDVVPAEFVIHYFREERAGQRRGIPDITPALPLFAQLRRFTLATIAAAETAADFAVVLKSNAPAFGDDEASETVPFDSVEIEQRMMTVLPEGFEAQQFKAEHPNTTYPQFKAEIINEIAMCLDVPYNIAAGNSSSYNYSSGRLDHQTYYRTLDVEREDMENVILDRVFNAFLDEAVRVSGLLPQPMRMADANRAHAWYWPGREHVDPVKEASAQQTRLTNNTTTLAAEYAAQGEDWEEQIRQRAKEVALLKELGLTQAQAAPAKNGANDATDGNEDDEAPARSKAA